MARGASALALVLAAASCTRVSDPKSDEERALYAMGVQLYREQMARFKLSPDEVEFVKQGFSDAARGGRLVAEPEAYQDKIQRRMRRLTAEDAGQEKLRGTAFQTQAALEPGAVRADSGLIFRTLKPGRGRSPGAADVVKAHYKGTLIDGKVFDSSVDRGKPLEFSLDGVIPCWTEGLQRMRVGETAKLVCPAELAYGDRGFPPAIPGGATLVFEVELLETHPRK